MELITLLKQELNEESRTTRKMLSRVPPEKFDWQPHPKSMTLGRLASHVAELPGWVAMAVDTHELDFADNPYEPKDVKNTGELLDYFEESLKNAKEGLERIDVKDFNEPWTLRNGEQILNSYTKYSVIRMAYSQVIHHRAQLGVYLRLLNIPIPGSYGPSADEVAF